MTNVLARCESGLIICEQRSCHFQRRLLDQLPLMLVRCEQRLDFTSQHLISAARFIEKNGTTLRLELNGGLKQFIYLLPTFRSHKGTRRLRIIASKLLSEKIPTKLSSLRCIQLPLTSRCNHALAARHSRITVTGESFIASAVSSTLKPPKNLNSTILLLRSSILARLVSAPSSATNSVARS